MIAKPPVFFVFIIPLPKDLTYVSFRFFILLDLNVFLEVIKILQESIDHAQFKTIQAWRVIYRLNP